MAPIPHLSALDDVSLFNECYRNFLSRRGLSDGQDARLEFLQWIKSRILRSRCLYLLSRVERGILNLSVNLASKGLIRLVSDKQIKAIGSILRKVSVAVRRFSEYLVELGMPLLNQVIRIAESWGFKGASEWVKDKGFAQYLAAMRLSMPGWLQA